ncbi:MAG: glycosyltransferase family 2 protein [candidate division WOR-3 bacterium]
MSREKSGISCVFPAYNEEKNIETAIREAIKVFVEIRLDYEIIVVDDGSEDGTSEVTLDMAKKNKNIRLIKHPANFGYADALKTGFKSASKKYLFYTDADNQFDLKDIKRALPLIEEADMVIGYRSKKAINIMRKVGSFGYNLLARKLLALDVKDIDCAFKIFRREVFDKIEIETRDWLVDAEVIAKACKNNMIIKENEVRHLPRKRGKVTVKAGDVVRSFKGLLNLRKMVK